MSRDSERPRHFLFRRKNQEGESPASKPVVPVRVLTKGITLGLFVLAGFFILSLEKVDESKAALNQQHLRYCRRIYLSSFIESIAFAPDGKTLAVAGRDGSVTKWELSSNKRCLAMVWDWARDVVFTAEGSKIAATNTFSHVGLWDSTTGRPAESLEIPGNRFRLLALSPDGRTMALGGLDGKLVLWDVDQQKVKRSIQAHHGLVGALAFNPDGDVVATGGVDGTVSLWRTTDLWRQTSFRVQQSQITSLRFGPGGRTLACSGSADSCVRIWDTQKREVVATLRGHSYGVPALTFSPDGTLLATVGGDGLIKLWETHSWEELVTLHGHEGWLWSAAFSPDGKTLATGGADRTLCLWDCSPTTLARLRKRL